VTLPRASDALVVGLGPAGAAAAIRLSRAGFRVVAIDRAVFPRDKVCSEYMSPEALRHLDELGVLGELEPRGMPLHGATVIGPRGNALTGLFREASVPPFRPTGLSLSRRELDAVLVDAARRSGVAVLERTRLLALLRDTVGAGGSPPVIGAVVQQDSKIEEIRARVVVGADGLHSITSRLLGGRRHGVPRRYAFVAHVRGVGGVGRTAEMHVGRGAYLGINGIGGGITNVAVVASARRAAGARGDAEEFWFRTLESFPAVSGRVPRDGLARPVLASGPFAAWSRRVVADGALLVGDAADFFDPFTGEGICAALRGAELAARTLGTALGAPGPVTSESLLAYRQARRRAFLGKWAVERMIGWGMLAPALFDRAIGRLERRGLAHTLVGVTGDFVPAREVLRPGFLAAMVV